jgi:hypothetical protein
MFCEVSDFAEVLEVLRTSFIFKIVRSETANNHLKVRDFAEQVNDC